MVTFFLPNTGSSLLSARISRRFSGSCRSCCLMYSQTLRTTSPRGKGPGPTTAASSLDGCSGCCSPLGLPPALFFDPVGSLLALVGMVVLPATWSRLALVVSWPAPPRLSIAAGREQHPAWRLAAAPFPSDQALSYSARGVA